MNRRELFSASFQVVAAGAIGSPAARNGTIQEARDAALAILKPSQKDLEHGLALHADSVVFDAYGFSPRSALDPARVRTAIEAGVSSEELIDLSEDMAMTRHIDNRTERVEYMEAWKAAGVTCIFQNSGEEGQDPLRLIKRLARFTHVTDMMGDFIRKAAVPDDVIKSKKEGKHCLYFTGNGVPLRQAWVSVEDELRYVRVFFQLGIRMMHLTYNRRNMIGDGCAEPANAGLSDFGRAAIAEMNRVGVIPDVAHSGWQTSLEAAKVSSRPIVASHSTAAAVHRHFRGKPDEVIRAIVDSGGYIGICCIPRFLGRSGDILAFLDHVDYVTKRFGADHVAIGTDVAHTSRNLQAEKLPTRPSTRTRFEALWPPDPFVEQPVQGKSLAWTNWPLLTVGLVQRGHSDTDIRKIIGSNVLRVARVTMPSVD